MKRKNVIVVVNNFGDEPSVYGNFKKCCESEDLPYHSLKMKKFPISLGGCTIHKVEFN